MSMLAFGLICRLVISGTSIRYSVITKLNFSF